MYYGCDASCENITLTGIATDGTKFSTNQLQFSKLNSDFMNEHGVTISPKGFCTKGLFELKLIVSSSSPKLKMQIKGFSNFGELFAECELGKIVMDSFADIVEPDCITGYISIQSKSSHIDIQSWRVKAGKMIEHVRRVMSLASSSLILSPTIEFVNGDSLVVETFSQGKQTSSSMRVISHLHQKFIFDSAVKSFFVPPIQVNNLFFAIEWFVMDSPYAELRLINSMTVLENLISSNLEDLDVQFLPKSKFEKQRKKLRGTIKENIQCWTSDVTEHEKIIKELNEKLAELNRRSLLQKIEILAKRWNVPIQGMSAGIEAAKKARDLIVHRGHYKDSGDHTESDLWEHVMLIREVVIRFLFVAIGFEGRYWSYLGGYHQAEFPPKIARVGRNELRRVE